MVPCVRFRPFVRFVFRLSSYGSATLGTGGWLDLTRQGLAPCKKRQACLGAHATEVSDLSHDFIGWKAAEFNEVIPYETVFLGDPSTPVSEDEIEFCLQLEREAG
jgi:hypothetical protein